jgi:type III pantothenate kinase
VNGLAAWKKFNTAVVIVDFGTATTVDAVSHDGHYLGGAIAPDCKSPLMRCFALQRACRVSNLCRPNKPGAQHRRFNAKRHRVGLRRLVKELVARCTAEMPSENLTVLATGGLAELIAPHVPQIQHIEPHLTLDGLRLMWNMAR